MSSAAPAATAAYHDTIASSFTTHVRAAVHCSKVLGEKKGCAWHGKVCDQPDAVFGGSTRLAGINRVGRANLRASSQARFVLRGELWREESPVPANMATKAVAQMLGAPKLNHVFRGSKFARIEAWMNRGEESNVADVAMGRHV